MQLLVGPGINVTIDYIKGSKGGGGNSQPPTRTPDNLRSKDTVEVILGLSEGPIAGLERGSKSFFIGDTPLQNESGDFNFSTFQLNFFPGNDVADYVKPVLGGTSNNTPVNVTLATNVAVTRQTQTGDIDFIDVRIAVQRLLVSNDRGTFNADLEFRIEYKRSSVGTWTKYNNKDMKISGKTTSTYVKEYRIPVTRLPSDTYDIRVTKLSVANTETYFADVQWESFQETSSKRKRYNNTAVIQLVGEASDQFSSIPQWSGEYKGLIVKVPSNYDPIAKTYSGVWNGDWQLAWTDNPAWCLYDFIMNDRYGIASYYSNINLDKYDVYTAAQWCDEKVPDGKGGLQARYTFNAYINEPRSGKEMARYIAGVFNAAIYDDLNGTAYLRVDKDDPATFLFTQENVHEGVFEYSYTDITSRYNDITVTFRNRDLSWEEDRRRVYNQELINKNGRIPLDFIAVGCLNEHEAKRRAWYKLITANTENCIIRYTVNRIGQFISPFDVVLICDPDMGYGISGRIKTVAEDRLSVTLRDPVYLETGVPYDITFTLNDGSQFTANIINFEPGYNSVFYFGGELPENLPEKANFSLSSPGVIGLPRPFRVLKVEENQGSPDSFTIEAININRNKWYDSDNITDSGVIDYSALPNPFNPPGPISCTFEERFVKATLEFQLTVSPIFNRGAYKYYANDHSFEVWSRPQGSTGAFTKQELQFGDTIINHAPGEYEFKVLGKSYLGPVTDINLAPSYFFTVTNPKDPPKDVDWLKINRREAYWGYDNPPDDFAGFILRYHNRPGRTTWDDAIQPHQGAISKTSFYTSLIPPSARVIMVRAVDAFGIVSENSAIIYRDLGSIITTNLIEQIDFHPTWAGTKVGCSVNGSDYLVADDVGALLYSGVPTALMYDGGDFYEASYEEMFYYDEFTVSHAGDLVVDIDFDGSGYEISMREVGETIWQPVPDRQFIEPGTYEISLRVFGGPQQGIVRAFSLKIDAEDQFEQVEDIVIAPGGTRVPLTNPFAGIKLVNVIIQDDGGSATAIGYRVIDKDPVNGPLIKLYNAAGTAVTGLVDVEIRGYR